MQSNLQFVNVLFISVRISFVLFSPGSVETEVGWGGNLKYHLTASCVRNICAKKIVKIR